MAAKKTNKFYAFDESTNRSSPIEQIFIVKRLGDENVEDIEDKLADNSLSQNGDTVVDQESISELAENETDNAIKLEDKIADALGFMAACGITPEFNRRLYTVNFWTSHEALHLPFEESMTRVDSTTGEYHDTSAHFVWIGDRTRQLDGGHVEFCKGIENPIGIKCGPTLKADDLINLCNRINPKNEKGKITLISRFGHQNVEKFLPKLIRGIKKEGLNVVWSCDPMHGNTITSSNGYKTRPLDKIISEVKDFIDIHNSEGTYAGGIHIEMTGQNVTECTGGTQKISEEDLSDRYHTHCDPRLNANQSLDLAFLISERLKEIRS